MILIKYLAKHEHKSVFMYPYVIEYQDIYGIQPAVEKCKFKQSIRMFNLLYITIMTYSQSGPPKYRK